MAYRASATEPKTRWARHLDKVLRERDWSRVKMFEEIGGELGYAPKSRSAFLPLFADKEPDATQAAVLRRHFGEPVEEPASVAEPATDLAAAIRELTSELRAAREERATLAAKVAEMEAILDGLVEPAIATEGAPGARHETTGSGR